MLIKCHLKRQSFLSDFLSTCDVVPAGEMVPDVGHVGDAWVAVQLSDQGPVARIHLPTDPVQNTIRVQFYVEQKHMSDLDPIVAMKTWAASF
jgi:hypothetical protein